jgi:Zn-dependent protease
MMKLSLSLGRYFGIQVFLHWSFLLFLIWIAFSNAPSGWANIIWTLTFILSVFTCITLHEFGHALMAKRFGIRTRDVTLYPIGGIASLEKMPEKPAQELAVALAGPAVNLIIAALLYPFVGSLDILGNLSTLKELNQDTLIPALFSVNVFLPLFNMIPAFPMDGGRVLRALLSIKLKRSLATRIAATLGQVFAVFMVIEGFRANPFLIVVGMFVFLAAESEAQYVKQEELLKGLKVHSFFSIIKPAMMGPNAP